MRSMEGGACVILAVHGVDAVTPADVQAAAERIMSSVARVMVGLKQPIRLLVTALLADGHVLLEEVPGTGKTSLARALAVTLGFDFARLQCTPDLLPSDVTGLYWFNPAEGAFAFRPGPVFANLVLVDELNRATPRTQSALLEAMAEGQVTLEGVTHRLPTPFLVVATQNPVELEGTFPLPEAQLDRFLLRLRLGYPSEAEEHAILLRHAAADPLQALEALDPMPSLPDLQTAARAVAVHDDVRGYLVDLARATRDHAGIELGASPRATLFLYRAAQAWAAVDGRSYVVPDDVKAVAPSVLGHRLGVDPTLELRGSTAESVVKELLDTVPVPVEAPA